MHMEVPPYYLPASCHCIFTRYYTIKCQAGGAVPSWVYDKYILPFC